MLKKTILITGANGEIGQSLIKSFNDSPAYKVIALDLFGNKHDLNVDLFIKGSITDKTTIELISHGLNQISKMVSHEDKTLRKILTTFQTVVNDYIKNTIKNNKVCTYPAYIKSKECPINVSGLVIEIGSIKTNDDNFKYENFYKSANWEFFLNACNTYGFMVDCNMPNRLVADIGSATMVEKMRKYNPEINSTDLFITNCYDTAAHGHFEKFKMAARISAEYLLNHKFVNSCWISKYNTSILWFSSMLID